MKLRPRQPETRPRPGDKVQIKAGKAAGQRGVIEELVGSDAVVWLQQTAQRLSVSVDELRNFSLAARRAWLTMPKRDVGRPKGLRLSDRVSVTLRIDRNVWEQFKALEQAGRITDRTATINEWLSENLEHFAE